jgi:hypothetical protein
MSHAPTDDTREEPPAPGSVSDQNGEEAEPGIHNNPEGGGHADKESGAQPREHDDESDDGGKRTQATGHPDNAG